MTGPAPDTGIGWPPASSHRLEAELYLDAAAEMEGEDAVEALLAGILHAVLSLGER